MSELIELTDREIDAVAGGASTSPNLTLQFNFNVSPQVAVGVAVLSHGANVNAKNSLYSIQVNAAANVAA
jgi:hypothetical protein